MSDKLIERIIRWRPFNHIAYWVLLILFWGLFWGSDEGYYLNFLYSEMVLMPVKMTMVYWTIYFLVPRYLFAKRYTLLAVLFFLGLGAVSVVLRLLAYYVLSPLWGIYTTSENVLSIYRIMQFAADTNTVLVLPLAYTLFKEWFKKQLESRELEQQRTSAELQLLKNQIHPHFLFNSLNSLYALVLKKSEQAPEVVLKLSALMRYQLHDASAELVELQKEIDYLNNYIALERLRYGNRFDLSFSTHGDWKRYCIAPLLLLPFVENAFKHGVSGANEAWLRIELSVNDEQLVFLVENSLGEKLDADISSGIGLKNVRRRLELLYPDRHKLSIDAGDTFFCVVLKVDL